MAESATISVAELSPAFSVMRGTWAWLRWQPATARSTQIRARGSIDPASLSLCQLRRSFGLRRSVRRPRLIDAATSSSVQPRQTITSSQRPRRTRDRLSRDAPATVGTTLGEALSEMGSRGPAIRTSKVDRLTPPSRGDREPPWDPRVLRARGPSPGRPKARCADTRPRRDPVRTSSPGACTSWRRSWPPFAAASTSSGSAACSSVRMLRSTARRQRRSGGRGGARRRAWPGHAGGRPRAPGVIVFRTFDVDVPFFWESDRQPAARWHARQGTNPVHGLDAIRIVNREFGVDS